MSDKKTLKSEFAAADAAREPFMKRARNAARLTHPTMLPEVSTTQADVLASSYQGIGQDGLSNIVNKVVLTIFPSNSPWFQFKPSARARLLPYWTPKTLNDFVKELHDRQQLIESQFNSTKYRVKFRTAFEHTLGLGNSLTLCGGEDGDYWFQNFRLDHFVQKRSSGGDVLWGITKEMKDPMELSSEDISRAELPSREELERKEGKDRNQELYTKWIRQSDGKWLIQQEMNDKIIRWSIEPVNPYLPLGYIELSGEDWSRGFVEEKMPWLRTFDTHHRSLLDWGVAISKLILILDAMNAGGITAKDLAGPSGQILIGSVRDGIAQGVAFLTSKMSADISVLAKMTDNIGQLLGKQFLLHTEAQRHAERVTATEVMQVASQLEGALGPIYAEIASEIQPPLLKRMMYQMERDKLLTPLPKEIDEMIDIDVLTGLEALEQQRKLENGLAALQVLRSMPELLARLSPERALTFILQGFSLNETRLTRTEEELEAEVRARLGEQIQLAAGQQAAKTAGAVIEEGAKQQAATAAPAA